MSLLALFGTLIFICLAFWAARKLLAAFEVGEPISTVVYVLLVVILVVFLLGLVGVGSGLSFIHLS